MGWFYVIQQEMICDLGLKGNELIVFAVINGYSQEGQGCYYGSLANLQEMCGITKPTVISTLKSLIRKGLINKFQNVIDGKIFTCYSVCFGEVKKIDYEVKEFNQEVKKFNLVGKKSLPEAVKNFNPDNIVNNKINNNNIYASRFSFLDALKGLGVPGKLAEEYLAVRKTKRLTNTETAFNKIASQIAKSGRTAEDCIRVCVENSWGGFNASWMKEEAPAAEDFDKRLAEIEAEAKRRIGQ